VHGRAGGDGVVAGAGDDVLDAPDRVRAGLGAGDAAAPHEPGAQIGGDVGADRRHVERVVAGPAVHAVAVVDVVAVAGRGHEDVVAFLAEHRVVARPAVEQVV